MPNLVVWRPCDTAETAVAWRAAVERLDGPTALVLSRQKLEARERTRDQLAMIARGGYILASGDRAPELILIATGSEVGLAVGAADVLGREGLEVRVVSMPSLEAFGAQPESYRAHVLPEGIPRLVIEAGVSDGWWRLVAGRGDVVGMSTFGESAPAEALFEHFGFTVDAVAAAARRLV